MYQETIEPSGNRKKMFWRVMLVLFIVAVVTGVANHFRFYPGLVTLAVLLVAAVLLFGEFRRTFVRFTYVYYDETLSVDRRVGSVDTIVEEVKKADILSLEQVASIPEGETHQYCGENREIYKLTHTKGSFYFTPGRGLLGRLQKE